MMNIVSIIFFSVGFYLLVQLVLGLKSFINISHKNIELCDATVISVTSYEVLANTTDSGTDTYTTMYRAQLEYLFNGRICKITQAYSSAKECSGDQVKIYVDCENPEKIFTPYHYKAAISISNMIGMIVFYLLFIIPFFVSAFLFKDVVFQ